MSNNQTISLTWGIVRVNRNRINCISSLDIVSPSYSNDEEGYVPAESITLHGDEDIKMLRDFLIEVTKPEGAAK